jgi:hypothetical protein
VDDQEWFAAFPYRRLRMRRRLRRKPARRALGPACLQSWLAVAPFVFQTGRDFERLDNDREIATLLSRMEKPSGGGEVESSRLPVSATGPRELIRGQPLRAPYRLFLLLISKPAATGRRGDRNARPRRAAKWTHLATKPATHPAPRGRYPCLCARRTVGLSGSEPLWPSPGWDDVEIFVRIKRSDLGSALHVFMLCGASHSGSTVMPSASLPNLRMISCRPASR